MEGVTSLQLLLGAIAALAGVAGTVWVNRRRNTGNVRHTDAEQLWQQQDQYIKRLEGRLDELEKKVQRLEREHADCLEQNARLSGELAAVRASL